MADDVGYSDVGCYGGEIRTPNLDGQGISEIVTGGYGSNLSC